MKLVVWGKKFQNYQCHKNKERWQYIIIKGFLVLMSQATTMPNKSKNFLTNATGRQENLLFLYQVDNHFEFLIFHAVSVNYSLL